MDLVENGTKKGWIILSRSNSITGSVSNDDGDRNFTYLRI